MAVILHCKLKAFCILGCMIGCLIFGFAAHERLQAEIAPQFSGNKVIPLIKTAISGVPNRQVIANIYEVPVGAIVPRHFHHGDEFHLILAGEWAAEVEGRPVRIMKPGDSQYVEGGRWHGGKVVSQEPLRLLGLMIVENDKPVTEFTH